MDDKEGEMVVRMARKAVDAEARRQRLEKVEFPESFKEKRGAFVTLHSFPDRLLRGCIGIPEPVYPLSKALLEAATSACHDPRFPSLDREELDHIIVEVSVLTPPNEIKVEDKKDLPKNVEIGKDGLIVEMGPFHGLLLPQVPVEWEWNSEEFLGQTCIKAGLTPDCWLDKRSKFYKFQAEIFSEKEPHGKVEREKIE